MSALLPALLASSVPGAFASLAAFRAAWIPAADPFEAAVVGGLTADRLGYAFAAGYASALRRLVPALDRATFACLCVTEAGGAHPRAIQTTLGPDGTLTGHKQWTTLASGGRACESGTPRGFGGRRAPPAEISEGDVLLVAACTGHQGDRPTLRVALVRADAPGITLAPMPPTPFVPEIPHYSVTFDATPIDALLPGDGWDRYVKPFRTVEDIHICGAALGYLVRVARAGDWPQPVIARLVATIVGLQGLADAPPDDPSVHIALGGVFDAMADAIRACEPYWASADPEVAVRWRRDAPLLEVANRARAARLAKAWQRVG